MGSVKTQWAVVPGSLLQVTQHEQGSVFIPSGPCGPQCFCDFSGFSDESPWECGGQGGIALCPWCLGKRGAVGSVLAWRHGSMGEQMAACRHLVGISGKRRTSACHSVWLLLRGDVSPWSGLLGPSGAQTSREGPVAKLLKGNLVVGTLVWRGCASRGEQGAGGCAPGEAGTVDCPLF